MPEVRRRYLYAASSLTPISPMTADTKELLAWHFYLDDRRKKRADKK